MGLKLDISEIYFEAGGCFGECPIFNLSISADGTVVYYASLFTEKEGIFISAIPKPQLDRLVRSISKCDFFQLENEYEAPCTCMPTYTLAVTLKNGLKKTIEDYGPIGPHELQLVYKRLFSIRKSQQWE